MKKKHIQWVLIAPVLFFAVYLAVSGGATANEQHQNILNPRHVAINGVSIAVDIADDTAEQVQGLSGTPYLPSGTGLLFVYKEEGSHGIWMKDMHYPIDIIWIDSDHRIVGLKEEAHPSSYPEVFSSPQPSQFVLEVNAGMIEKMNGQIGDDVIFIP